MRAFNKRSILEDPTANAIVALATHIGTLDGGNSVRISPLTPLTVRLLLKPRAHKGASTDPAARCDFAGTVAKSLQSVTISGADSGRRYSRLRRAFGKQTLLRRGW